MPLWKCGLCFCLWCQMPIQVPACVLAAHRMQFPVTTWKSSQSWPKHSCPWHRGCPEGPGSHFQAAPGLAAEDTGGSDYRGKSPLYFLNSLKKKRYNLYLILSKKNISLKIMSTHASIWFIEKYENWLEQQAPAKKNRKSDICLLLFAYLGHTVLLVILMPEWKMLIEPPMYNSVANESILNMERQHTGRAKTHSLAGSSRIMWRQTHHLSCLNNTQTSHLQWLAFLCDTPWTNLFDFCII